MFAGCDDDEFSFDEDSLFCGLFGGVDDIFLGANLE